MESKSTFAEIAKQTKQHHHPSLNKKKCQVFPSLPLPPPQQHYIVACTYAFCEYGLSFPGHPIVAVCACGWKSGMNASECSSWLRATNKRKKLNKVFSKEGWGTFGGIVPPFDVLSEKYARETLHNPTDIDINF
jgi:hypothetical protein